MDIRHITAQFAVAPQIRPEDIAALADNGYEEIICNRPEFESGPGEGPEDIKDAAVAAGLSFRANPAVMGQLTLETVEAQKSTAKTLAYCASGTRSALLWALAQAGSMPTEDILAAIAGAGYPMEQLAPQIDALARQNTES